MIKAIDKNEKKIMEAKAKSKHAMRIFHEVINELKSANEQIASTRQVDCELMQRVEQNIATANQLENENNLMIDRISHITGEQND